MISFAAITAEAEGHHCGPAPDWPVGRPSVGTYVECRMCGFEPAEQLLLPRGRCPKCRSDTWRRSIRPGTLLAEASGGHFPELVEHTERDHGVAGPAHRYGFARL